MTIFYYFFIYSFIGWIIEIIYTLCTEKKLINRGFLIGPVCPIYGIGAILVTYGLYHFFNSPLSFFIISTIVIAILEYTTSYIMEKVFQARWWDYSDKKFNLNGRICLEILLSFGILSTLAVYVVNPMLLSWFNSFSNSYYKIILIVLVILFVIDLIVSFNIIVKFDNIILSAKTDNTEEISKKVREILFNSSIFYRRILGAFPHLKLKIRLPKIKAKIPKIVKIKFK